MNFSFFKHSSINGNDTPSVKILTNWLRVTLEFPSGHLEIPLHITLCTCSKQLKGTQLGTHVFLPPNETIWGGFNWLDGLTLFSPKCQNEAAKLIKPLPVAVVIRTFFSSKGRGRGKAGGREAGAAWLARYSLTFSRGVKRCCGCLCVQL